MKKTLNKLLSLICSAGVAISAAVLPTASADWVHIGYMGDLNGDRELNMADLVLLSRHLLGTESLTETNCYLVDHSFIGINGADGFQAGEYFVTADIDQSGEVDIFDLIQLRKAIVSGQGLYVWQWQSGERPHGSAVDRGDFIYAGVDDVYKYMPSQGDGRLLIVYADFYDCKYDYQPTVEEIEQRAFGEEDTSSKMYPFESVKAFYDRSSKGAKQLSGKAYIYTAKHSKDHYQLIPGQRELVAEALASLDEQIDYKDFDGNGDGYIDTVLLVVPQKAGDETWWPAAVQYDEDNISYDGIKIGHMITGNCQIESKNDCRDFTSTILHEMGHCMGLPDYYLYGVSDDYDGLHGTAGSELMDDTGGDFSCVSKLQLGWYKEDQVNVYRPEMGTRTFTLYNAQTDKGNTVIIPNGDGGEGYHGEYMMLEYTTKDGNNSSPPWYVAMGEGVRVYHAEMSLYNNGWWSSYRYESGSEFTDNNAGRRFIRLIDDSDTDNIYKTGDIIDEKISGFRWYDDDGRETIETEFKIEVGEINSEYCTVTLSSIWDF